MQPSFDTELSQTDLTTDTVATLGKAGVKYVAQLLQLQHIRQVSGLGRKGKMAVSMFLQRNGYTLGQDIQEWKPPATVGPAPRVQKIGPPKNGSIYKVLLIGGEKRGKEQVGEPLAKRGAVIAWHWTVDKKRQRQTVTPFPKDCDIVLRMADLAATYTNQYKAIAKKDGVVFLSITRKKAQWLALFDELGLKERSVPAESVLAEERRKKTAAEQAAAEKTIEDNLKERARVAAADTKRAAGKNKHVPAKAPKAPKAPKDIFGVPEKTPQTDNGVVTVDSGGYTLEPIAKTIADLMVRNKVNHAVYTLAQRVDRISRSFESLLPLVVDAMQREGIRGLMITDSGKSIEYSRNTPDK